MLITELNDNKANKDWKYLTWLHTTSGTHIIQDISSYSELLFMFTYGSDQIMESAVIPREYFCANTSRQVIMHDSKSSQTGTVQYLSNTSVSFNSSNTNWSIYVYAR